MNAKQNFLKHLNDYFITNVDNSQDEVLAEDVYNSLPNVNSLSITYIKQMVVIFLYDAKLRKSILKLNRVVSE